MYVNLTPHDIHIWEGDFIVRTYPRTGTVARCAIESIRMFQDEEGNDVYATRMGAVTDLPEEKLNVFLIVSSMVANHPDLAHRADLVCPFTPVLDDKGRTVGCRALCMPNTKWDWESYPANFEE